MALNLLKPLAICLICLLPYAGCFGQDDGTEEEKSAKPEVIVKTDSIDGKIKRLLGHIDGAYYLLVKKGLRPAYSIVSYTDTLTKLRSAPVFSFKNAYNRHNRFEKVLLTRNKLILFTTQRLKIDGSTTKNITFAETLSPNNLQPVKRDSITSIRHSRKEPVLGKYIIISPDSSKIGLVQFQKTGIKNILRCTVRVYDNELNLMWGNYRDIHCSKQCINRQDENSFYSNDNNHTESVKAQLNNEGYVFILSPNPDLLDEVVYDADTIKYYFYTYSNSGTVKELGINGYDGNTIDMMDFYYRNDSIVFSGVCSKKTEASTFTLRRNHFTYVPQGTFLYKYNLAADTIEKLLVTNISVLNNASALYQFINAGEEGNIVLMVGAHHLKDNPIPDIGEAYGPDKIIAVKRSNAGEITCMADVLPIYDEMYNWLGFYQNGYVYVIFNYFGKTYMVTTSPDCQVEDTEIISKHKIRTEQFGLGKDMGNDVFLYVQKNAKKRTYSFIKIESGY